MTRLIIARHGNTFESGQSPTRIGARTDLPLTGKGLEQGRKIGEFLKTNNMIPDIIYCSTLQRTQQTAREAIKASGISNHAYSLDIFNEIDYGPDENKPEAEVIERIGETAIKDWDERAIVPPGWLAKPQEIIQNWQGFAAQLLKQQDEFNHEETVLVVTSNGIARFAPHITGDFDGFKARFPLKLSTGALGILQHDGANWRVTDWNIRP